MRLDLLLSVRGQRVQGILRLFTRLNVCRIVVDRALDHFHITVEHLGQLQFGQTAIAPVDHLVGLGPVGAHHADLGQQRVLDPGGEDEKARVLLLDDVVDVVGRLLGKAFVLNTNRLVFRDVVA